MPNSKTDVVRIQELKASEQLATLDAHVRQLNIFRATGIQRNELLHSRFLATILDPLQNRSARSILIALLHELALVADERLSEFRKAIDRAVHGPLEYVKVHREHYRIDVLLEIGTAEERLILGIENKIDHAESEGQISRYQDVPPRHSWCAALR